jgi:predicted ATP-grasp superfamily ATP-dependent carboligase
MRALITTSRMPVAIDLVRKLGQQGHRVTATDTFSTAPGSHSKYVDSARLTASPRNDTLRFVDDVSDIIRDEGVDILVPAFEEVFYLAKHRAELPDSAAYFFPRFETLLELHDKARFADLARRLRLAVPASLVATSCEELASAVLEFPRYFAKPIFSRGGVNLLTNAGPLAGALRIDECTPSPERPWIVQEFIQGTDVCTCSVVHEGRITGHAAYVHPREIEHAGGIVFESVDEPECLAIARELAEKTGYHGLLSLDFLRTERGMVLIECNPRPTAGLHVMSPETFEAALLDRGGGDVLVAEPGVRRKYSVALVRDMLLHVREAREDLEYLFSDAKEVVADPQDLLPALYQVLSYGHVMAYRRSLSSHGHKNTELMSAYFADVCWNGEEMS